MTDKPDAGMDAAWRELRQLAASEEGLSCVISDALGRGKAMSSTVRPMWAGARLLGRAVTAWAPAGDLGPVLEAIDAAGEGDVIVVQGGDGPALWGENTTLSALSQRAAGAVLDAPCRDRAAHERLGFPVFATGSTPRGGLVRDLGRRNCPVTAGGVRVEPGDVILADENGVVVIPAARLTAVVAALPGLLEQERRVQEQLLQGATLGRLRHPAFRQSKQY